MQYNNMSLHVSKFKKIIAAFYLFLLFLAPVVTSAQGLGLLKDKKAINDNTSAFQGGAGYADAGKNTLATTVARIITVFLGLLGTIFLILVLVSGWNWFTAQGDSKKIEVAKSRIINAVVGLIIVISAYAITVFVFREVDSLGVMGSAGGSNSAPSGSTPLN